MKEAAEADEVARPEEDGRIHALRQAFHTVIGDIAYDKKGDRTNVDYVWYVWKKGPTARSPTSRCDRIPHRTPPFSPLAGRRLG